MFETHWSISCIKLHLNKSSAQKIKWHPTKLLQIDNPVLKKSHRTMIISYLSFILEKNLIVTGKVRKLLKPFSHETNIVTCQQLFLGCANIKTSDSLLI